MNQANNTEDLIKIGEKLFELQEIETKAIKDNRGCPIYSSCDAHPHRFCDKSYLIKIGKKPHPKKPITFSKRYFLCETYRKYVSKRLEDRACKDEIDLDYIVSTLISFYSESCQFQDNCSKYDVNEDRCKNDLTAPERLMDCREPYANFIYKIISEAMKNMNLKKKKLRLSEDLIESIQFIGPDNKRYPITHWFMFVRYGDLLVPYEKQDLGIIELDSERIKELNYEGGELAEELSEKIGKISESEIEKIFKEKMFKLIRSKKN